MIRTSESTAALAEALAKVQAEMPPVAKTKTAKAGSYSYSYADIADVLAVSLPVLGRHGLSVLQPTVAADNQIFVVTRLSHSSGEWVESDYPVCVMNGDHQKMGGALTYARRYALCSLVGIASDEDADAQGLHNAPQRGLDPGRHIKARVAQAKTPEALTELMLSEETQAALEEFHPDVRTSVRAYAQARFKELGGKKEGSPTRRKKESETTAAAPIPPSAQAAEVQDAGAPEGFRPEPVTEVPASDPETTEAEAAGAAVLDEAETLFAAAQTHEAVDEAIDQLSDRLVLLSRSDNERFAYLLEQAHERLEAEAASRAPADDPASATEPPAPPSPAADPFEPRTEFLSHDDHDAYLTRALAAATGSEHYDRLGEVWTAAKAWRRTSGYEQERLNPLFKAFVAKRNEIAPAAE